MPRFAPFSAGLGFALFAALAAASGETPEIRLVVANDNYTGSRENGESGRYLGADDFLTVSFLGEAEWGMQGASLDHNVVTSRKLGFRYDLLTGSYWRWLPHGPLRHRAGLELIVRGDFAGEEIQNGFHDLKGLPPLHLPYEGPAAAAAITWMGSWEGKELLRTGLRPAAAVEARLPTGLVPLRLGATASLGFRKWIGEAEGLLGWRSYLTRPSHYGELIRSGPVGGFLVGVQWPRGPGLAFGAGFFPARNLENDPLFKPKARSYSPQLWTSVSWGGSAGGLRSLLRYF